LYGLLAYGQEPNAAPVPSKQLGAVDAPGPPAERSKQQEAVVQAAQLSLRFDVGAPVYDLAFSPDGKILATVGKNGLRLFEVNFGERVTELAEATIARPEKGWFHSERFFGNVAFSADAKRLAASEYIPWDTTASEVSEGRCRVWSATSGKLLSVHDFEVPVSAMRLSSDGRLLAVGDMRGGLAIAEASGETLWRDDAQRNAPPIVDLAFSADGSLLAAADDPPEGRGYLASGFHVPVQGDDGTIRLIDVKTRKVVREISVKSSQGVHRIAFAPDGQTLFAAYEDGHLRRWQLATGKLGAAHRVQSRPWFFLPIAFSGDGNWLASADSRDECVAIWRLAAVERTALLRLTRPASDLTLSFSGKLLACCDVNDEGGEVSIYQLDE
jgi:WD40 repeat protein